MPKACQTLAGVSGVSPTSGLKKASSIWAADHHRRDFAWQDGYAVFSVSKNVVVAVNDYIAGQEDHHRKRGFIDELQLTLHQHGLEWDTRSLP